MSPAASEAPRGKAEALLPVTSVGPTGYEHGGHLSQMAHAPGDRVVLKRREDVRPRVLKGQ